MDEIFVKSLQSVQRVMINDKHCFEMYLFNLSCLFFVALLNTTLGNVCAVSSVTDALYCGGHHQCCRGCWVLWVIPSVLRVITSVHWRVLSKFGDIHQPCRRIPFSNMEDVHHFGDTISILEGYHSVLWRMFSTVGDTISATRGNHQFYGGSQEGNK